MWSTSLLPPAPSAGCHQFHWPTNCNFLWKKKWYLGPQITPCCMYLDNYSNRRITVENGINWTSVIFIKKFSHLFCLFISDCWSNFVYLKEFIIRHANSLKRKNLDSIYYPEFHTLLQDSFAVAYETVCSKYMLARFFLFNMMTNTFLASTGRISQRHANCLTFRELELL